MSTEHERLEDLLLKRATEPLSAPEADELAALRAAHAEHADALEDDIEAAFAATWQSLGTPQDAALPTALQRRLEADAARFFGDERAAETTREDPMRAASRWRWHWGAFVGGLGWACAATLALALLAPTAREPDDDTAPTASTSAPAAAVTPGPLEGSETRSELMSAAGDAVLVAWARSDVPGYGGAGGDVLWSDDAQRGYLRVVGLPPNDPARSQYQLWIVDPERDAVPVDGGVFDVPAGGEAVIDFVPRLPVDRPTMFAITRERPGGVVVSAGPLLLIADAS